jgi:hypothetical protein
MQCEAMQGNAREGGKGRTGQDLKCPSYVTIATKHISLNILHKKAL